MILDRVTLKQCKTHCGRGLITDPIVYAVIDADAELEHNQPSGTESIEMHVSLTYTYGSRVLLATYTAILSVVSYT